MIRRLAERSGFVLGLVFAWKLALLIFTAQPVPANDSFFYDGAIVHYLNGGGYFNPSLAWALTISGNEVFCAYPPLYQAVLLGWMSVFGTSALAAMWLHLVLFGFYLLVLAATFRRLRIPAIWANLAALFLFVITFQDRPDSLAHLLGMAAIFAWARSTDLRNGGAGGVSNASARKPASPLAGGGWDWLMVALVVLTLATSLQIGAVYLLWIWLLALASSWAGQRKFPLLPMITTVFLPALLMALVIFGFPEFWEGFMEHALQTPSVVGWRLPRADELLKALRTAPGAIGAAGLIGWAVVYRKLRIRDLLGGVATTVALGGLLTVAAVVCGSLLFLTPNFVLVASYAQPLIVGCVLASLAGRAVSGERMKPLALAFVALAALGAVRAVGMTTWGVACAADLSHQRARRLVNDSLDRTAPRSRVVLSSAFLYEAARHKQIRAIHSDWLDRAGQTNSMPDMIIARKPAMLILTQFDYYRRYADAVRELQQRSAAVAVKVTDTARTPPPDASRKLQRIVQHISWAPVIVELSWK